MVCGGSGGGKGSGVLIVVLHGDRGRWCQLGSDGGDDGG